MTTTRSGDRCDGTAMNAGDQIHEPTSAIAEAYRADRFDPLAAIGGGKHSHIARSRRRDRQTGVALQRRERLGSVAAFGTQGFLSRSAAVSIAARGHHLEVPRHV